ncbi:MAG: hypothetical protein OEV59_00665 [Deltaproteobacteria bacterium]|nr:hypothetical protein [Deltaproteobacteria bacterium]
MVLERYFKKFKIRDKIALPLKTNCSTGPKICFEGIELVLYYFYEYNNGDKQWVKIDFDYTLAFECRQAVCIESKFSKLIDSSSILICDGSDWQERVLNTWYHDVGRHHKYLQELGGKHRFKHYSIYFDDEAYIWVLAAGIKEISVVADLSELPAFVFK